MGSGMGRAKGRKDMTGKKVIVVRGGYVVNDTDGTYDAVCAYEGADGVAVWERVA